MSGDLTEWLACRRAACRLSLRPIPWRESRSWRFRCGRLEHVSGGFFSVAGIRTAASVPAFHGICQPIIDQPEVGILGFIVRPSAAGREWLVQAKAEPGNVGEVHLAPSVQATRSNYMRVHGGAATPYIDRFIAPGQGDTVVRDSLQSEHGNRFLGKYNSNVTLLSGDGGPAPHSADWRWVAAAELRAMLTADFAVNTDARSVLFCSDWKLLAEGAPFARWRGGCDWRAGLPGSFEAAAEDDETDVLEWLDGERRRIVLDVQTVELESLPNWEITGDGIVRRADGRSRIGAYAVEANSREVGFWDQPFYLGDREEEVVQLCQQRDGVLRFLMRASIEAGFRERVQVGPSWQSDDLAGGEPPARLIAESIRRGRERMATLQSDEGGRFFHSVCRYRIVEVPADRDLPGVMPSHAWLTLGQISRLSTIQGVFTNEARSVFSMLLAEV